MQRVRGNEGTFDPWPALLEFRTAHREFMVLERLSRAEERVLCDAALMMQLQAVTLTPHGLPGSVVVTRPEARLDMENLVEATGTVAAAVAAVAAVAAMAAAAVGWDG